MQDNDKKCNTFSYSMMIYADLHRVAVLTILTSSGFNALRLAENQKDPRRDHGQGQNLAHGQKIKDHKAELDVWLAEKLDTKSEAAVKE